MCHRLPAQPATQPATNPPHPSPEHDQVSIQAVQAVPHVGSIVGAPLLPAYVLHDLVLTLTRHIMPCATQNTQKKGGVCKQWQDWKVAWLAAGCRRHSSLPRQAWRHGSAAKMPCQSGQAMHGQPAQRGVRALTAEDDGWLLPGRVLRNLAAHEEAEVRGEAA